LVVDELVTRYYTGKKKKPSGKLFVIPEQVKRLKIIKKPPKKTQAFLHLF
jgi:hypothetical protein